MDSKNNIKTQANKKVIIQKQVFQVVNWLNQNVYHTYKFYEKCNS